MLVGRSRELDELAELLDSGRPGLLVGEAGVGKSALLRVSTEQWGRDVFHAACLAPLSWYSYLPLARAIGVEPPVGDVAHVADWVVGEVAESVLVVDDMHWADAETVALLPHLAGRIRLLAAVRRGDPGAPGAIAACSAAGLATLTVGPVSDEAAREIVLRARAGLASDTVDRIVVEAGGSPLLLEELAYGNGLRTLRLGLHARLSRCSPAAQRSMAVLGALARPAEPALAGAGVAELADAGLLAPGPLAAPRHALLGEIAVTLVPERERRRIHAELAARVDDPGEAARHHHAAGNIAEAHAAALSAAERATAPGDRARLLQLAAVTASGRARDPLLLEAADALVVVRSFAEAEELLSCVASRRAQDRARVHLLRARCLADKGLDDAWEEEIRAGLALVEGSGTEMETLLRIELVERPVWACDAREAVARASTALELAERTRAGLGRAHAKLAQAFYLEQPERCEPHLAAALEHAGRDGDGDVEMLARFLRILGLERRTRKVASANVLEALVARATELGLGTWALTGRYVLACARFSSEGASPETAGLYEDVLAGFRPFESRDQAIPEYALLLGDLGRDEEARAFLVRAPTATSGWGAALRTAFGAELHWLAGRFERAVETAAPLASREGLFGAEELARCTVAVASLELGRAVPDPAPSSRELLNRHTGPMLTGVHALQAGDWVRAETLLDEAAALADDWCARDADRCGWLAGEAARRAGARDRARRRLRALDERLAERGNLPLLRRVRRSLRQLGDRRGTRPGHAFGALTEREREVLQLIGGGLSSRDTARRLALSVPTVESHVRSARAKLGVRTRLEAVAVVREHAAAGRL